MLAPHHLVATMLLIWVSLGLLASCVLFGFQVFGRNRAMPGQIEGFVFTAVTLPLFIYAFADRFPHWFFSGAWVSQHFVSSGAALLAMGLVYVARTGVFLKLFALPAFGLSESEFYSPDRIEERANDFTAPLLAFTNLAIVLAAAVAGTFELPWIVGGLVFIGLFALYSVALYLRDLRKPILWLVVQLRIAWRAVRTVLEAGVTFIIIGAAKFEMWRRQGDSNLEDFVVRMERKLRDSQRASREADAKDRDRIRKTLDRGTHS